MSLLDFPWFVHFTPPFPNATQNERTAMWCHHVEGKSEGDPGFVFVFISDETRAQLKRSAALSKEMEDPSFYTLESFSFATSLVHELAHAVRLIRHGKVDCYFPTSTVCEDGFAWGCQVFGGLVETALLPAIDHLGQQDLSSAPRLFATRHPWPSEKFVCHYVHDEQHIGLRLSFGKPPLAAQIGQTMAVGPVSPLNFTNIDRIFTKAFWDPEDVKQGLRAFRFSDPGVELQIFPKEWVTRVLDLYVDGSKMLDDELVRAETDNTELDHLNKLRQSLDRWYAAWDHGTFPGMQGVEAPVSSGTRSQSTCQRPLQAAAYM